MVFLCAVAHVEEGSHSGYASYCDYSFASTESGYYSDYDWRDAAWYLCDFLFNECVG